MTHVSTTARRSHSWRARKGKAILFAASFGFAVCATVVATSAQEAVTQPAAPAASPVSPAATNTPLAEPASTPTAPRAISETASTDLSPQVQQETETITSPDVDKEPVAEGDEIVEFEEERDSNLPHDLSPWGMFMAADWVVKGVMLGLAFASLITWTVWFAKSLEIAGAKARLRTALKAIYKARSLDEALHSLEKRGGAGVTLVRAAAEEVKVSEPVIDHLSADGLKERVASRLSRIQAQSGRRLMRGTGVLATIGSTAPFVGLFGTVWGIMNSFIGISEAQTTNLAVVAPGIAEALLATAIGLVAAIPAVMIYNVFARSITGYKQALGDAVAGIERLVSRDLDFRQLEQLSVTGAPRRPSAAGFSHAAAAE